MKVDGEALLVTMEITGKRKCGKNENDRGKTDAEERVRREADLGNRRY